MIPTFSDAKQHLHSESARVMSSSLAVHRKSLYYALLGAVVLMMIAPVWTVSVLPLADYGDHLARVFILAHYADVPAFQHHYVVKYLPLPNLAIDLIGTPLMRRFDPYTTGKLFISLMIVLFALGTHYLSSVIHTCEDWLAVPVTFLFYNSLLYGGFVNYSFSVAMMLLAGAAWLMLEAKPSLRRGVFATVLACITYLSHIAGFACLCCLVTVNLGYGIIRARRVQLQNIYCLLPLVPGLVAYWSLGVGENSIGKVRWDPALEKVKSLWTPFNCYSVWLNVLMLGTLIASIVLVGRCGTLKFKPGLLSVALALGLAFFIFPFELRTGAHADERFLVPALVVGVSAVVVQMPRKWARIAYLGVLVVFSVRIVDAGAYWRRADAISVNQLRLLRLVPEGSSVYPLVMLPEEYGARKIRWQLAHLAGYATLDRHAISGSMWTNVGQQPVRSKMEVPLADYHLSGVSVSSVISPRVFATYDYIWGYDLSSSFRAFLGPHVDLVEQIGEGALYRVRHDSANAY